MNALPLVHLESIPLAPEEPVVEVASLPDIAEFSQPLAAPVAELAAVDIPPADIADLLPPPPEAPSPAVASRWSQFGKRALFRAGVEVVGVGVDALLMGAGKAGIGLMRDVVTREITATVPEVAALDKFLGRHKEGAHNKQPKHIRAAKKLGHLAMGVTTAVLAQKGAVELASHINSSLNQGFGEYAVPLSSKFGALTALSAAQRRLF
jgi:hypothetical protein